MTADLRHAIRDAVPKLEAIADELRIALDAPRYADFVRGVQSALINVCSTNADLLSALSDDSGVPGPTTAQEGQEGRSGQISGVSGETVIAANCGNCWRCLEGVQSKVIPPLPVTATRMLLCPTCGNKRCPKASDHTNGCTGSNEPGQPGSVFPPFRAITEETKP